MAVTLDTAFPASWYYYCRIWISLLFNLIYLHNYSAVAKTFPDFVSLLVKYGTSFINSSNVYHHLIVCRAVLTLSVTMLFWTKQQLLHVIGYVEYHNITDTIVITNLRAGCVKVWWYSQQHYYLIYFLSFFRLTGIMKQIDIIFLGISYLFVARCNSYLVAYWLVWWLLFACTRHRLWLENEASAAWQADLIGNITGRVAVDTEARTQ